MLKELNRSILYRGIPLEQDCKQFVAALDHSIAANFVYPDKMDAIDLVNAAIDVSQKHSKTPDKGMTFERFYKSNVANVPYNDHTDGENYAAILYLYF